MARRDIGRYFYFIEQTREYLIGKLRKGETSSGKQTAAFILQTKSQLLRCVRHVLLRANGEFQSWESVQVAKSCGYDFTIANKKGHKPVDHRMRSSNNRKGSTLHAIFNGDVCRVCSKLRQCPVRGPKNRQRGSDLRNSKGQFSLEINVKLRL